MNTLGVGAAVIGPALIAFAVYWYRSVITYDLITLSQVFRIVDQSVVYGKEWPSSELTLEELVIKNRGWKNLQKVRLHLEHTPSLFDQEISSTTSISKRSVTVENDADDLLIEIAEFPRGEEIKLKFAYFEHSWGRYREMKGASGKFKLIRQIHWNANRGGIYLGVFVGTLFILFQIVIGLATK